jgi:acetyl-CoA synthetase
LLPKDAFYRGEKLVNLKELADESLEKCREK